MSSLPVQLRAIIGAQLRAAESIQRVVGSGPAGSVHADSALPNAARRSCCRRAARRITDPWVSKVSRLLHRPAAVGKPANLSISGADRGVATSGSRGQLQHRSGDTPRAGPPPRSRRRDRRSGVLPLYEAGPHKGPRLSAPTTSTTSTWTPAGRRPGGERSRRRVAPTCTPTHIRPAARRASRSRRADERNPGGGAAERTTMSQIRAVARGTTRAGIPTPRRACSRPATPRP